MNRKREEALLRALNDVGDDLIAMAGQRRFSASPWRRWGALAASLALVVSLTALALPYLPMGCGSSEGAAYEDAFDDTADAEEPAAAPEEGMNKTHSTTGAAPECECEPESEIMESELEEPAEKDTGGLPDELWMLEHLVLPLERWQVGTFESPAALTEDGLERLALAVLERDGKLADVPAENTEAFVREVLDRVLEGYTYAPQDQKLPLDGTAKDLPVLELEMVIERDTVVLEVLRTDADGTQTVRAYEMKQQGDNWYYISVTRQ